MFKTVKKYVRFKIMTLILVILITIQLNTNNKHVC